ncbi:MAG: hypothetical protein MUF42_07840 [Cytophagaceae bacterium]|nr:hypothetical protein [Cytophagaceae bacterium]
MLASLVKAQSFDFNLLHSESGKRWVPKVGPDENRGRKEDYDDSFIFYSNGKIEIDLGAEKSQISSGANNEDKPSGRSVWTVSERTMKWVIYVNGQERVYYAELIYLRADRMLLSLQEPGNELRRNITFVTQ